MAGSTAFIRRISVKTQGLCVALILLAFMLGSESAKAQVLYGSITGTVTDQSGAVVPNAIITLTNQETAEKRNATADGSGGYSLLDVLPGTYTIAVAAKGNFGAFSEKDVRIEVNRQVRIDIGLQPAAVTAQITVTEAPPELQTETAEVNSEISQAQLNALPITSSAGRNYQALYTIIPGASAVQEKNSTSANPSRSMSVNINGNSYNGNTTRIDGAVNYYGWLPYLIAYVPPADDIENVSFTTNAFTAEQGQAGGAAIKISTKSGGSQFHGSGWEYYQDAAINAKPYTYTTAGPVPKYVFHQFGFNVGGPVYFPRILTGKKKLFFFENFERTTQRKLISGTFTVPTRICSAATSPWRPPTSLSTIHSRAAYLKPALAPPTATFCLPREPPPLCPSTAATVFPPLGNPRRQRQCLAFWHPPLRSSAHRLPHLYRREWRTTFLPRAPTRTTAIPPTPRSTTCPARTRTSSASTRSSRLPSPIRRV